jgi:hypothetical protein
MTTTPASQCDSRTASEPQVRSSELVIRPARLKYRDGEAWAVAWSGDFGKTITVTSEEVRLCILRGQIAQLLAG